MELFFKLHNLLLAAGVSRHFEKKSSHLKTCNLAPMCHRPLVSVYASMLCKSMECFYMEVLCNKYSILLHSSVQPLYLTTFDEWVVMLVAGNLRKTLLWWNNTDIWLQYYLAFQNNLFYFRFHSFRANMRAKQLTNMHSLNTLPHTWQQRLLSLQRCRFQLQLWLHRKWRQRKRTCSFGWNWNVCDEWIWRR